jgi:16S rRNA C1402 (ribose-2'-O) methylase RsmI
MVKRRMESVDRKIKDLLKDEELTEKERNQAITKELRKKIQEIKTTNIYTDTEKASMVLKIQGEILKYK